MGEKFKILGARVLMVLGNSIPTHREKALPVPWITREKCMAWLSTSLGVKSEGFAFLWLQSGSGLQELSILAHVRPLAKMFPTPSQIHSCFWFCYQLKAPCIPPPFNIAPLQVFLIIFSSPLLTHLQLISFLQLYFSPLRQDFPNATSFL